MNYQARVRMVVSIALLMFAAIPTLAQLPTGTILGVVKDTSGGVVAGATVTAKNVDTGLTRTIPTEADGSYRFPSLLPGNYEVQVSHAGFETANQSGLTVTVGQEAVVNITLTVGATAQSVTVTEAAPVINTTSGTTTGTLVDEQAIVELPLNGGNYDELNLLQPGVSREWVNVDTQGNATAVVYSSDGAPTGSNLYLLDGAITLSTEGTSPSSAAETALGTDGIQEFRMVTNASSAQYGLTMGSVVTEVSKGGTNQFHGNAFEWLRNSAMDAANFFDPTSINFPGKRIAPLRRNQYGGALGGPIKKNKTFFFTTYEQLSEYEGEPVIQTDFATNCFNPATKNLLTTNNPCATSTLAGAPPVGTVAPSVIPFLQQFQYPNEPGSLYGYIYTGTVDEHYGQMRVDHIFSPTDSLFVRYTMDDTTTDHPQGWPGDFDFDTSREQFLTIGETHVISTSTVNDARFSFSRVIVADQPEEAGFPNCAFWNAPCISNNDVPGTSFACSTFYGAVTPGNPPTGPGCIASGGITITGISGLSSDSEGPDKKPQQIWTISDDVSYTHGKHAFTLGTLINHYSLDLIGHFAEIGSIGFLSPANFFAGLYNTSSIVDPAHSRLARYWKYQSFGFYAQDDYRLTSRLTVNLGLRYEFNTVPTEDHGVSAAYLDFPVDTVAEATSGPPFRNASLHNFSPRVGLAWDVFGDGKTSIRAGIAHMYDIAGIGRALNQSAIGQPPFAQTAAVTAASKTLQIPLVLPLPIPATYPVTGKIIDYNVNQPNMFQYNLTIEHQFPGSVGLSVAYAGSRGIHLWQVTDANPKAPEPGSLTTWPIVGNSLFTAFHLNPNFNSMPDINTTGDSHYNSLQVSVIKHVTHQLQFQSAYTFSKSLDDFEGQEGADGVGPSQFVRRLDYGPSNFDSYENWRFNVIYGLPNRMQGRFVGKFIDGWALSAIESLQSGYPFNATMNTSTSGATVNNGAGSIDRPDLNPAFTGNLYPHAVTEWFNPAAFISPPNAASATGPVGVLGNEGRGYLIGPGLSNLDFSIKKDTSVKKLGEAGSVEFRADAFNIFNHPIFGNPGSNAAYNGTPVAGSAGLITSTRGASREIQLGLKVIF